MDHAASRWILTIAESTGRLTRWRLLLSEFNYEIDYIPGRVNSVPDAMSRVLTPAGDPQPVEADVPVFESNDHCDAECDHAKVLVTTWNQARAVAQKQTSGPTASAGPPIPGVDTDGVALPSSDKTPGQPGPADDNDFDIFDFDIQREGDDILDARDLSATPTNAEILGEQRGDTFCLQVLTEQDSWHRHFYEGPDGILRRRHPAQRDLVQIVLPTVLRPRVLRLCHYSLLSGHPGLNRMYYHIRRIYYWPHLAADVAATVRNSVEIAFCEVCIFKYGPPESVLTDTGKQFSSRFFQSVCQLLGLSNVYNSAYHPQANGQAERYNRTLQNMLMCFVEEHQDSWDKYDRVNLCLQLSCPSDNGDDAL